jgi:hypothetical protein
MLTTVEGRYADGKITLLEDPQGVQEGRVLVIFLPDAQPQSEHRQMVFGQFAGDALPTEEDFKIAEWPGEEGIEELSGG